MKSIALKWLALYSLLLILLLSSTPGQSVEHPPSSFESPIEYYYDGRNYYAQSYSYPPEFETPSTSYDDDIYQHQQHHQEDRSIAVDYPQAGDDYYNPTTTYGQGYGIAAVAPILECGYGQLRDRNGNCRRRWNLHY